MEASPLREINVGGELITTSIYTLTKVPESKLANLFVNPKTKVEYDKYGRVFIDSNPIIFRELLAWLQYDGSYKIPEEYQSRVLQELGRWGVENFETKNNQSNQLEMAPDDLKAMSFKQRPKGQVNLLMPPIAEVVMS